MLVNVFDDFNFIIEMVINFEVNKVLEGLYLLNGVYCIQCEVEGFWCIIYYFDCFDVLVRFICMIIGDKVILLIMLVNGNFIVCGENSDGMYWVIWEDLYLKFVYLFVLVVGSFDQFLDMFIIVSGKFVVFELYVDKGK